MKAGVSTGKQVKYGREKGEMKAHLGSSQQKTRTLLKHIAHCSHLNSLYVIFQVLHNDHNEPALNAYSPLLQIFDSTFY